MSPVRTDRFTVYVANLRSYGKTAEIAANPRVELCYVDERHNQVRLGGLANIVTERDVVKLLANEKGCRTVRIKDVMTTNLLVSKSGDDLDYVMAVMIQNNIRHLPVVEESGLVGMLSMRDVVRVLVKNLKAENQYLKDFIGGFDA